MNYATERQVHFALRRRGLAANSVVRTSTTRCVVVHQRENIDDNLVWSSWINGNRQGRPRAPQSKLLKQALQGGLGTFEGLQRSAVGRQDTLDREFVCVAHVWFDGRQSG